MPKPEPEPRCPLEESQPQPIAAGGLGIPPLTVQETDGTPSVSAVDLVKVPNGTLTDLGSGDVSLNYESPINKNVASGYPGLDGAARIAKAQAPSTTVYTDEVQTVGSSGAKKTFTHSTSVGGGCGVNVKQENTDPGTGVADGDLWNTNGALRYRESTTNREILSSRIAQAKGDLIAASAANAFARLAVGADGQVLAADSAQASGVKWAAAPAPDLAKDPYLLLLSGGS